MVEEVTGPFIRMKSTPLPSTSPKEKDNKHSYCQGRFRGANLSCGLQPQSKVLGLRTG